MEQKKLLTTDQVNKLKETVRQRFDELYHRIGSNRQNLFNKVLFVDQQINKEVTKEQIDDAREKDILRRVREAERSADSQLPHIHKVVAPASNAVVTPTEPKTERPAKESKPKEQKEKESKPKAAKPSKTKPAAKKKK